MFQHTFSQLIHHYGSFGLFFLLAIGIIGLPVPDETLLLLAGFLAAKGKITLFGIIFAAFSGSICGISLSYFLGRTLGYHASHRYGKYIGFTQAKLKRTHDWFEKYGKWLLLFGYYIPGVRHLTGLVAGTTKLDYRIFALFAYTGAICWSSTFLIIGYFFYN